jgi:hypothetical protein
LNIGEAEQKVMAQFPAVSTLRDVWAKEDMESAQHLWLQLPPHTVRIVKSSLKITDIASAKLTIA